MSIQPRLSTRQLVSVGLLTALVVVFAVVPPIPLPWVPVPLTLQTLGVMLAGLLLGGPLAAAALTLYVALALIGLPVLPGGRSGLAVLVGPTGGFLLGFIPGAWVVGWVARHSKSDWRTSVQILYNVGAAVLGGIVVVYAMGVPWLATVTGMGLNQAVIAVAAFLPGDLIKAGIASVVAVRLGQLAPLKRERD